MDIKNLALSLRKKYKTNNPFEIIKAMDIECFEYPLGNLNGFYNIRLGKPFICINSNLSDEQKIITAAHELGHALLHPKLNTLFLCNNTLTVKSKFEKQADTLAAEVILSDDIFEKYHGHTIDYIAKCERVSKELIQYKYNNL
jgi:Zn-dependent peptidase ImmA (M78 family)